MPTVNPSAFGPKPFWVDAAGNPTVSYKLFMYVAGSTSTKQNSYTNSTGSVANTNPIILNALGQTPNELWWDTSLLYKVVLAPSTDTDPPTNPVWTVDNLQGMNSGASTIAANEWVLYSTSAIAFVSASSFTLIGNQTLTFHIGRRLQFMTSAGFVYGRITNSVFAASTTVTVQMDGAQVLDSGLSAVYYSILTNDVLALPERIASTTGTNTYSATVGIARLVIGDQYKINIATANNGAVPPTLSLDGNAAIAILTQNGLVPGIGALNGAHEIRYNGINFMLLNPNIISLSAGGSRQSINSGPVDVNGFFAPGGVTGAASLTTTAISPSAPLIINAAGGSTTTGNIGDRIGVSSANLTFTGLSINGIMYLYGDVVAGGAITPGSGTLAPAYQRGGTFSVTSGQFTYNSNVKMQTVGTGAAATQSFRTYLGEVTVAGGVVTAIIWYRLNNKYDSIPFANPNVSGGVSNFNSNIGLPLNMMKRPLAMATNPTALDGWSAGATYEFFAGNGSTVPPVYFQTPNVTTLQSGASAANGFYYQTTPAGAFQSLPASAVITIHLEGDL
jgi:hypothetical protein